MRSKAHRSTSRPSTSWSGETSRDAFLEDLTAFASQHRAKRWCGTFAEFLEDVLPTNPICLARSSHQYVYDMLCWYRDASDLTGDSELASAKDLFTGELFGIDGALDRVIDYFKAAAAGSDVVPRGFTSRYDLLS